VSRDLAAARADLEALAERTPRSYGRVTLDVDGDLAWVRLDHPSARNAMTVAMMVDLAMAVERLASFDGRAVIVASAEPGAFCSGGHLDEVPLRDSREASPRGSPRSAMMSNSSAPSPRSW